MILITGASQGIGYECATQLLARTGEAVTITGRSLQRLRDARRRVAPQLRDRLLIRRSDQSSRRDVDRLCDWVGSLAEPLAGAILGIGVNPAFTLEPQRLHAVPAPVIEATIRTNCIHAVLITSSVLARLAQQRGGALIWIGSRSCRTGLRGAGVYTATKSFLTGLALTAAAEYAGRGVRPRLVHPGLVRTPRTAATADRFARAHGLAVAEPVGVASRIVDLFLSGECDPVEVDL